VARILDRRHRPEDCKPVDYDPNRDIQVYSSKQNFTLAEPMKLMCPALTGGKQFLSASAGFI
jgi:hypothetical protein